jgi:anti-sigma factor RsiW
VSSTERTQCLDAATLAALVQGKLPPDRRGEVQAHLPACSKCLGIVAAGVHERARSRRPTFDRRDTADRDTTPPERPMRYRPMRLISVVLSLLALGGSVASWRMGGVAGTGDSSHERLVHPAAIPQAVTSTPGSLTVSSPLQQSSEALDAGERECVPNADVRPSEAARGDAIASQSEGPSNLPVQPNAEHSEPNAPTRPISSSATVQP